MKKIALLIITIIACWSVNGQSVYLSPSIGVYLNSDIKQPIPLIGYGLELGYCFENDVCAGVSYGTLDLVNNAPFVQARTGYTLLDRKRFSLSIGAGLGYVFRVNQLIGEGDVVANIHMPKDVDFTVSFANQVVYKVGYLPAINIGITKYFSVKKKNKK